MNRQDLLHPEQEESVLERRTGGPIHVLHLIGSTGLYGAERWVLALMRAVDPGQVRSSLINLVDTEGDVSEVVAAAHQRGLQADDFGTGGKFNPLSAVRLARWSRRHDVDIIHGHGFKSDVVGLLAARMAGCRMISTPHGWSVEHDWKLEVYERLDRTVFRFMDRVCPLSSGLMDGLLGSLPPDRLRLIRNGVDIEEIAALQCQAARTHEAYRIGYIGRLVALKSVETLLGAVPSLAKHAVIQLTIIGDGPKRQWLHQEAERLGIAERVEFLGFRADAASWLPTFDVFVLPSLSEGIPRCIMEAMAASIPVIVSDIAGNRNLVAHGETGLLFSSGDSRDLAEKIRFLMDHQDVAEAMALRGKAKVEQEYSSRKMAAEYAALYRELTADRR